MILQSLRQQPVTLTLLTLLWLTPLNHIPQLTLLNHVPQLVPWNHVPCLLQTHLSQRLIQGNTLHYYFDVLNEIAILLTPLIRTSCRRTKNVMNVMIVMIDNMNIIRLSLNEHDEQTSVVD